MVDLTGEVVIPRSVPVLVSAGVGIRWVQAPAQGIVLAMRWYLRFHLSYRDAEELLVERGSEVDHVTVYRWLRRFTPMLADAARFARHSPGDKWFIEVLGLSFEEITTEADLPGYRRFWCSETGIGVVVLAVASPDEPYEPYEPYEPGDVWSIQPERRGIIDLEGHESDRRSTTDGLAHLLRLEPAAMWQTWLQRRQGHAVEAN